MAQCIIKSAVLWCISQGLRLPQTLLDRVHELSLLKRLLAKLDIDCVLDVGANCGQFARELRGIGYNGHIISFEPVTHEFLTMKEHFKSDLKWSGFQTALGSNSEFMTINVPGSTVMSSFLEADQLMNSIVETKETMQELVEVKRLDSVLPQLLEESSISRVFLKMDTQGYDLEVFRGAFGCMEQIQGLQSELSVQRLYKNMPNYLDSLQEYEAAGFGLYSLSTVCRDHDKALVEMNCYMRRMR
jgi:FkbM family methyltransferase